MRKLLSSLRKLVIINLPVRWIIKQLILAAKYWPVSGIINMEYYGIKFKLFTKCDDDLIDMYYYYEKNWSENHDLQLFLSLSKESKIILDIGANIGVYSILSAK